MQQKLRNIFCWRWKFYVIGTLDYVTFFNYLTSNGLAEDRGGQRNHNQFSIKVKVEYYVMVIAT